MFLVVWRASNSWHLWTWWLSIVHFTMKSIYILTCYLKSSLWAGYDVCKMDGLGPYHSTNRHRNHIIVFGSCWFCDLVTTGICRSAQPATWPEGSGCWLWYRWRRFLHGKGQSQGKHPLKHGTASWLIDDRHRRVGHTVFQTFGVEVLGLDLSENMVDIAMARAFAERLPSVCWKAHTLNAMASIMFNMNGNHNW